MSDTNIMINALNPQLEKASQNMKSIGKLDMTKASDMMEFQIRTMNWTIMHEAKSTTIKQIRDVLRGSLQKAAN